LALHWSPDGTSLGVVTEQDTVIGRVNLEHVIGWVAVTKLRSGTFALGHASKLAYGIGPKLFISLDIKEAHTPPAEIELDDVIQHIRWSSDGKGLFVATRRSLHAGIAPFSNFTKFEISGIAAMALDPTNQILALSIGDELRFASAAEPLLALDIVRSPRGSGFDIQCHPKEALWLWACQRTLLFLRGPDTDPNSRAQPVPNLAVSDLPLLAYHLVLAGHARPDLLQDFTPTTLLDAIQRVSPRASPTEAASVALRSAKSAREQPNPLWLAWVNTTRKAELANATIQLNTLWSPKA
jgi:hypothetical protein